MKTDSQRIPNRSRTRQNPVHDPPHRPRSNPDAAPAGVAGRICRAENLVRFIDAFVDGLDLAAAGFTRVQPKMTGRPGYAPRDLLKLYIYGYLNRVRSSRRLEPETHRNVGVIWLLCGT